MCYIVIYTFIQHHNDTTTNTDAWRITQDNFFRKIFTSHFIARFERVLEGLHVRGCWRLNITSYFDPTVMTVTLCLYCSPDVGVYSTGDFRGPPRSCVAFPTTSGLYCLEFDWQLHRGFSECPLGRVWPSLPHLVSTVTISPGYCFGTPNSTELNNNSTPTRSPTGSLNRMFNCHQAEITVMQFRGYSLPVHHNGSFTLSHLISLNPPTRSLPITGHWNV